MMWSTIANLKENLNKIAHDVHDQDDEDVQEFGIYGSVNEDEASPSFDRRNSHSFAHSKSYSRSPLSNGIDSTLNPEVLFQFQFLVDFDYVNRIITRNLFGGASKTCVNPWLILWSMLRIWIWNANCISFLLELYSETWCISVI